MPFRANHLEMIFDKEIVPYYGWLFPESATRVNIGITYEDKEGEKRNARELFQSFLDRQYGGRIAKGKQVGAWKGHPVAYSYKIDSLTAPGRITIGESGLRLVLEVPERPLVLLADPVRLEQVLENKP